MIFTNLIRNFEIKDIDNYWFEMNEFYINKVVIDKKCGITTSTELPKKWEFGGTFYINQRKANLKFNQDDIGMMRHKSVGKMTDKIFRLARSEGSV